MSAQNEKVLGALGKFFSTSLDGALEQRRESTPIMHAIRLFHDVVGSVPAYVSFLNRHGVDANSIRTPEDFVRLPMTTKKEYLSRHSLTELCREGKLESCDMIAVSSGSTGTPHFWPRFVTNELSIATRFEQVFFDSFEAEKRTTLAVICFPLGTWVGGMYTAACCRHVAAKGYPITVVTPGNQKEEILRVVQALAPNFEQTVLLGYPPFVRDVLDTGVERGFDWKKFSIRFVFAGEVFSEEWRDLVSERVGLTDVCRGSASLYGTADAGVLGNETPLSVSVRRFFSKHPEVAKEFFGKSRLPTLVQYDPWNRFFEVHEGTLLFSGDNGIPLIRYHIADEGGVVSYDEMMRFLGSNNFDPREEIARTGSRGIRPLPFVYVFGRSHFIVSYFGANIYPENVSVGLEQPAIRDWVTGKFVMEVRENDEKKVFLAIVVELASKEEASAPREEQIAESIVMALRRLNSEFANYVPVEQQTPHIELRNFGNAEWFPVGVKHRYTRAASP